MRRKQSAFARHIRLAAQIQRDLSEIIAREIEDARISLVTLQRVDLTPDYTHAKVWFTTLAGMPDEMCTALNQMAGHLRALLFKRLHVHTVPTLCFIVDKAIEQAIEISRLIDQANAVRAKD